ncbi:cytochrome c oxidase subunit II [Kiritimatiellota bacterium B12222]|nr:cytochrome c oxidase subunit II [Kiritimatiellota bacterium B12222]
MKAVKTAPEVASIYAHQVDNLYAYLLGVSIFFTVVICALIIFFSVRYRRQSDADRPEATKDGKLLEILGSVIPFILVMIMFFWGAKLYFDARIPPKDAIEVLVTGKQWMWKLQHPNGKREINDLHVPVGVPIKLTMTSEDVIHSFYLPDFRKKMDVVPGKYSQMWFLPEKTGTYNIFCAEYCGTEHSLMVGKLIVMEQQEYAEWLSHRMVDGVAAPIVASDDPAEAGKQIFESNCMVCHTGKAGSIGPHMVDKFGSMRQLENGEEILMDDNYVRNSMINPNEHIAKGYPAAMTSFKGTLNPKQMNQVIAYLKSQSTEAAE